MQMLQMRKITEDTFYSFSNLELLPLPAPIQNASERKEQTRCRRLPNKLHKRDKFKDFSTRQILDWEKNFEGANGLFHHMHDHT